MFNVLRRITKSTISSSSSVWLRSNGGKAVSGEARLAQLLRERFPEATAIEIQDISGGCGAMYEVWVEAPDFKGLKRIKQHQMITETLKEEIKDMHGLRITTSVP
ncbi:bolA-like protein 3 [Oratosquilla oratoria]|uniref:bolA-like protein 3 n=1 Tax=Oratosquilla oratoria TaxID=337810 RepID=UPI003F761839